VARAAGRSLIDPPPEPAPRSPKSLSQSVLDTRKIATLMELDAGDGFFAQVVDDYLLDVVQLKKEMTECGGEWRCHGVSRRGACAEEQLGAYRGPRPCLTAASGSGISTNHALLMRAPAELQSLEEAIEQARRALLSYRAAALESPQQRREGA
jgi:hypothetical protein